MGEFDDQLQKAIQRGQLTRAAGVGAAADDTATEEQFRQKHAQLRNELSDYIETRLRTLCDHFPGFEFQTVVNEKGWGAAPPAMNTADWKSSSAHSQMSAFWKWPPKAPFAIAKA
jgi:hypothetical protein